MDSAPHLRRLLGGITPYDDLERAHLATADAWLASGAPVYRTRKPDVPPTHLVSYFAVLDEESGPAGPAGRLLLVAHRGAGLWLPAGGHVEPAEDPWRTVRRECREELGISAVPATGFGPVPFFLTVTATRGPGTHTDVSLWYVLRARARDVVSYDEQEFAAIRWQTPDEVLAEPPGTLDPHMHRFTGKLLAKGVAVTGE
jgi:8-oxo-dGTP pyrophosphatase MutT (NUDIX family)